jgi:general secretion pathway protein D
LSSTTVDVITTKRKIKTNVLADDGETIVLGGLISDDVKTSEQKVPLLGDIPFLGALFRSTSTEVRKSNLMIFLRPTILRDKADAQRVTQSKFDELWELNLELKAMNGATPEELQRLEKPEIDGLYTEMQLR